MPKPKIRAMPQTEISRQLLRDINRRMIPQGLVQVPSLRTLERDAVDEARGWEPENLPAKIRMDKPETVVKQTLIDFNTREVADNLRAILRIRKSELANNPKVTVFAGFTGGLSRALANAGFDVLHTDPVPEYANQSGLQHQTAHFHALPNRSGTIAHISFEGFPAIAMSGGYPGVLRTLANTSHGLVLFESKSRYEYAAKKLRRMAARARNPQQAQLFRDGAKHIESTIEAGQPIEESTDHFLLAIKRVYGGRMDTKATPNFLIKRLWLPEKARGKIRLDLRLLEYRDNINRQMDLSQFVREAAAELGVKPEEAMRAINRITAGFTAKVSVRQYAEQLIGSRTSSQR